MTVFLMALTGCSLMVKTPVVANYNNLDLIDKNTTKNDVAVLLGTPQGVGMYGHKDSLNELQFYYGFAGKFSMSGANYDSGFSFITYKDEKPVDLIYFTSKMSGHEIQFKKEISIKQFADSLQLGKSTFDELTSVMGQPDYIGRRVNFPANIYNTVGYWDASQMESKGAIKEKWLLVGYDENKVIQDLIWVSSDAKDIKAFGEVTEQQMKQMSRTVIAGFLPVLEATGLDTGTKIDAVQVDALLKTNPKNVKDVIKVIGKPTALGIKSFKGDNSLNLSHWSFMKLDVKGQEHNYVPSSATEEQRKQMLESTFTVISVEQSRLMIGHTPDGEIKEILWTYPTK